MSGSACRFIAGQAVCECVVDAEGNFGANPSKAGNGVNNILEGGVGNDSPERGADRRAEILEIADGFVRRSGLEEVTSGGQAVKTRERPNSIEDAGQFGQ